MQTAVDNGCRSGSSVAFKTCSSCPGAYKYKATWHSGLLRVQPPRLLAHTPAKRARKVRHFNPKLACMIITALRLPLTQSAHFEALQYESNLAGYFFLPRPLAASHCGSALDIWFSNSLKRGKSATGSSLPRRLRSKSEHAAAAAAVVVLCDSCRVGR